MNIEEIGEGIREGNWGGKLREIGEGTWRGKLERERDGMGDGNWREKLQKEIGEGAQIVSLFSLSFLPLTCPISQGYKFYASIRNFAIF